MAKRSAQDTAAAKAKKQKIILIVGGVLLLAVAAFQGPKLMKGSGSSAAPPPAAAVAARAGTTGAPSRSRQWRPPAKGSAVVAGVALPRSRGRQGRDEPACVVHALRGQGSVRPEGRRRDGRRRRQRPPADQGAGSTGTTRRAAPRLDRLGATDADAAAPPGPDRLRDDRLQHEAAAGRRSRARSRRPSHCSSSAR